MGAGGRSLIWCALLGVLAGGCARGPEARAEGWREIRTAHVRLRTDLDERSAVRVAQELSRLRDAFAATAFPCAFDPPPPPVEVTVLARDDDYEAVAGAGTDGRYLPPPAPWPSIAPQILLPARATSTPRAFAHELTHRLVARCFARAPVWLHEGLASLFETARLTADTLEVGFSPYVFSAELGFTRAELNEQPVVSVPLSRVVAPSRLVAMSPEAFYRGLNPDPEAAQARQAHYASAWALAHLLVLGEARGRQDFDAFTGLLARGVPHGRAFREAFAGRALDAELAAHVRARTRRYVELPLAPVEPGVPTVRPMSLSEAHQHWAALWDWSEPSSAEQAERHLALARSGEPTARALLLRAALALRRGDGALAWTLIDSAARRSPQDPDVLTAQLGMLALAAEARDADTLALARSLARSARRPLHLAAAAQALARTDPEAALALSRAGSAQGEGCWRCAAVEALALLLLGHGDEAGDALHRALAHAPHGAASELRELRVLLRRLTDPVD